VSVNSHGEAAIALKRQLRYIVSLARKMCLLFS
jgi:hypothetical protein